MIQRIQTLFLLIAWGLFFSLFFVDMVTLMTMEGSLFTFNLKGFYESTQEGKSLVNHQWAIFLMSGFINLLFAATISLFRKRIAQIRICIYLIIFMLGLMGVAMYKIYLSGQAMEAEVVYHLPMLFPLISSILIFLAFRAIRKDEILVKAYERLRP